MRALGAPCSRWLCIRCKTSHMSSSLRLGKPSVTAFFSEGRSSFGTRHESQAEERTEEIAEASPRSWEMEKIKGTALRLTPLGFWNVTPVKDACRAESK